jgi:hypothetical protein
LTQRQVDVGEEMAELAKAHGQVEDADAQQEGQQRLEVHQQAVQQRHQCRRQRHAQPPGDGAMAASAVVEFFLEEARQPRHRIEHHALHRQRAHLFERSRTMTMESSVMGLRFPGKGKRCRVTSMPAVAPQMK